MIPAKSHALDEWIAHVLSERGLRSTKAVRSLLRLLHAAKSPMSPRGIFEALKPLGYDLSTVHRILTRLTQAKLVHVMLVNENARFFGLAAHKPTCHQILDRKTGGLVALDAEPSAMVTQVLELMETKLRENGYSDVSSSAILQATSRREKRPAPRNQASIPSGDLVGWGDEIGLRAQAGEAQPAQVVQQGSARFLNTRWRSCAPSRAPGTVRFGQSVADFGRLRWRVFGP